MENTLTYKEIIDRCKQAALEIVPSIPKVKTGEDPCDVLQDYIDELESFDSCEAISEEVDSWDWTIYTHYGWKILHAINQSDIDQAESEFLEFNSGIEVQDLCGGTFDIWSLQSSIAYHYLVAQVREQVESVVEDMIDLAQTTLDNY